VFSLGGSLYNKSAFQAGMAELADAADSKSAGTWYLGGSTPPPGTISKTHRIRGYLDSLSACDQLVQQTQRTLRQYITNERLVYATENGKFTYKML
jgi:hypothetical protein